MAGELAIVIAIIAVCLLRRYRSEARKNASIDHISKENNLNVLENIIPVDSSFDWQTATPLKIRPFVKKRNFNPSMGIKSLSATPEEWLLIEDTYLLTVNQRKSELARNAENVVFSNDDPKTKASVAETYSIIISFLVSRYPQYFVENIENELVTNEITNSTFPRLPDNNSSSELLKILTENIEEDLLILIKNNENDTEEEYIMRASINGAPAGFDPKFNHNKPVSSIHSPVPQYKSRLQLPMHKFFNNLQPKNLWVRYNWSIQINSQRYNLESLHGREGEKIVPLKFHQMDFNQTFLRCERQIFTRLPKSRANLMTIRTYLTPINQIKQEGLAEDLVNGIDSLPEDLAFYKRRSEWGEAVKQYLRQ